MTEQNADQIVDEAAGSSRPKDGFVRVRVALGYQIIDATGAKIHRLAGEVIDIAEEEATIEAQHNRVRVVDPSTPLAEPSYPSTNPPQVE